MCGLAGYLNSKCDETAEQMRTAVERMAATLHHRGPDDTGLWYDATAGIALGHKRLSIVDLSPAGHQPMASTCGTYVIAYNGEVYNHQDLRQELASRGHAFRGHSDTEVLVEGFAEWGIQQTIRRCLGMFAIAVWDTRQRRLTLIRDRLGKKPLYYAVSGFDFLFGSESKSLRAHRAFHSEIDRAQLFLFLRHSYLPHGASIYSGVRQVMPGTIVSISANGPSDPQPFQIEESTYWSLDDISRRGLQDSFIGSHQEATEQLDSLLTDAVGRRMLADVPLGAFLSGGIDSSLIVALMQKQSSQPIKTYTIGFEEHAYNEAPYAKAVAAALKTDHTEMYVTAQQAREVIPLLPRIYDEPFADSSQIPTQLICQLARGSVTVALSGDGGDEIFCGYRRYFPESELPSPIRKITRFLEAAPKQLGARRLLATGGIALCRLGSIGCRVMSLFPMGNSSRRIRRLSDLLAGESADERYVRNATHWPGDVSLVRDKAHGFVRRQTFFDEPGAWPPFSERQQRWQWLDTLVYLPDDILTKVDRASMSVSLEVRAPLLDHRVVEFGWTLPQSMKVRGQTGKQILRDVLSRYVAPSLVERPKVGFGVPIDSWLRGPLREWAEELLDDKRLQREGYLNPQPVRQKWIEHRDGIANWHYLLWDVLMFQAWLEAQSRAD